MADPKKNKVLYYDPNPGTDKPVNLEDLCILVELETEKKGRNIIVTNTSDNSSKVLNDTGSTTKVRFNMGSGPDGTGPQTTKYTQASTTLTGNGDYSESLGITSIDIDFNASLTPIIKINFIDIRGNALLEKGNDSKYNVFFQLPYPIFKLKIKGFYGKTVMYCLHLMKYNSKFNSNTGNFEIQCDFIGYTYAFLSDMLIGYLKAIVETDKGADKLKEINTELKACFESQPDNLKKGKSGQYKDIVKISEFETEISNINSKIKQLKNDDIVKRLPLISNKIIELNDLKTFVNTFISTNNLIKVKQVDPVTQVKLNVFDCFAGGVYLPGFNPNGDDGNLDGYNKNILNKITDFNANNAYTLDINHFQFQNSANNVGIPVTNNYQDMSLTNVLNGDRFLDFRLAFADINILNDKLVNDKQELNVTIQSKITNEIDSELQFDSSVGYLFKVFTAHIDVFMSSIRDVAKQTQSDTSRSGLFKDVVNSKNVDIKKNNGENQTIYPFPLYSETDATNGGATEKWIGSNPKFEDIPEVKFIEDLLNGFLRAATKDNQLQFDNEQNKNGFVPVSLLDTNFFGVVQNPYVTGGSAINSDALVRLLISRAFLFLSYSNHNSSIDKINAIASLEANNMYNSVIDERVKNMFFTKYCSNITNLTKPILDTSVVINPTFWPNSGLISSFNSNYIFTSPGTSIPLFDSDPNNYLSSNNHQAGHKIGTPDDIIDPSNVNYIKIIEENNYLTQGVTYADYVTSGITSYITKTKEENYFDLVNSKAEVPLLNTTYKTGEILKVKISGDEDPINTNLLFFEHVLGKFQYSNTYGNSLRETNTSNSINRASLNTYNKTTKNIVYSSIDFMENNDQKYSSLFGSTFYYLQSSEASKALLFLHTLPLFGLTSESNTGIFNTYLKRIFNQESAFIKIPKAWILFMGGLLWRMNTSRNPNDPIIYSQLSSINIPNRSQYLKAYDPTVAGFLNVLPLGFASVGTSFTYAMIESEIINLPDSVKETLIIYFTDWVASDDPNYSWTAIKTPFEIYKNGITLTEISNFSKFINSEIKSTVLWKDGVICSNSFNINNLDFPNVIIDNLQNNGLYNLINNTTKGKTITNDLILTHKSPSAVGASGLSNFITFLQQNVIFGNSTPRIWNPSGTTLSTDFKVSGDALTKYLTKFITTFISLNKNNDTVIKKETDIKQKLFNSIDDDFIKLSIYRTIKAIYDKWIAGTNDQASNGSIVDCTGQANGNLYNQFLFIDKAYRDISYDFKVNPFTILNSITSDYNQNFHDFTSRVLADNNFVFQALPTFINYNNKSDFEAAFKPYTYNEAVSNDTKTINSCNKADNFTSGPQFVCVYIGQSSKNLDLGNDYEHPTDGVDLKHMDQNQTTNTAPDEASKYFNSSDYHIPAFEVNYAKGNQSMFKDIRLDQHEFSETDETLKVTNSIANNGDSKIRTTVSQNLFNIYSTRSYSCEVESMGNAQIQPMMYFQLNNIPMFRGAYMIQRVKHSLRPGYMTTTFTGVRINKWITPLVNEGSMFMNILGSLSDIDTKGVTLKASPCSTGIGGGYLANQDTSNPIINPNAQDLTILTQKQISDYIISKTGDQNNWRTVSGIDPVIVYSITKHESRQQPFDTSHRPLIRYESANFYRYLGDLGLKDFRTWVMNNQVNNIVTTELIINGTCDQSNDTKYIKLNEAYTIADRYNKENPGKLTQSQIDSVKTAAIRATSWGVGQILGDGYKAMGYTNIIDFVKDMYKSEKSQIDIMIKFIKAKSFGGKKLSIITQQTDDGKWNKIASAYAGAYYNTNTKTNQPKVSIAQFCVGNNIQSQLPCYAVYLQEDYPISKAFMFGS